jgi:LysR family transcriptional regulator of gallate degradation
MAQHAPPADPLLQTLDIRRLRHLRAAVAEGSLSGAAVTLGLSQPALSSSIKSLEMDLGVTLLERHRFGVKGTAYADTLVEHFKRVEAELHAAWTRVGRLRLDGASTLQVGCGPSEAMRLLPLALEHLRQAHPQLRVSVEYGLNERLMPMVRHGEIECALSSIPSSTVLPELSHQALYVDQAVVIARPDHPLAGRRSVSAADLAAWPWVLARRWELERKALDELFAHAGVDAPRAAVETSSAILMKTLEMQGDKQSFVPLEMIHWEHKAGLLRPLEGIGSAWERHVGITTRRDVVASEAMVALEASLKAVAKARLAVQARATTTCA